MTSEDDHSGEDGHRTAPARPGRSGRRRSRVVAGVASLAAVLGAGAYVTTSAIVSDGSPVAREFRPLAPASMPSGSTDTGFSPSGSADAGPSPSGSTDAESSFEPALPATPTVTAKTAAAGAGRGQRDAAAPTARPETPEEVRKKVTAARKAAEEDGFPLKRPLEPAERPAGSGPVSETTQGLPGGATMRITTVKGDLTGRRPLTWAADRGEAAGENRCTRRFRFSEGDPGSTRPTMLLCWRTSASRSVAVLSVDKDGTPSAEQIAAVIDREWKKLD